MSADIRRSRSTAGLWLLLLVTALAALPGITLRVLGVHPAAPLGALVFGGTILAAAFILSWAAETAEMDISQGLALAVIAFIAVLPEYAVDLVLAWKAGADPAEAERGLAIANMTGGNRLLIGVGWPVVFFLFWLRTRTRTLSVDTHRAIELTFLLVATAYVMTVPIRDVLTLADSIVLISLFVIYLFYTSKAEAEEVELVGPARAVGSLTTVRRRVVLVLLFVYSAAAIMSSAEPFADSLVQMGEQLGVSEFVLIQWLAPLASESPEVLVAALLAWRGRAAVGMGALISSKVNQWTLLVGTLPIAFSIAAGQFDFFGGLPLDHRQREEIFLTAAQSAFAIAVFANLRMSAWEATSLFVLFATQLFLTDERVRLVYSVVYLVLCLLLLATRWREARPTARAAWAILRGRDPEAVHQEAVAVEPRPVDGPATR